MSDEAQFHVALTYRVPSGATNAGTDQTILLVGTAEKVAAEVAHWVENDLTYGRTGPFTISAIHPARVVRLDTR